MKRNRFALYWLIGLLAVFLTACGQVDTPTSATAEPAAATPEPAATAVPNAPESTEEGQTPESAEETAVPDPAATEPAAVEQPAARPQLVEFYADW